MAIEFDPYAFERQYSHDKEAIARNWFFVGHELRKLKRENPSTKNFGKAVATSSLGGIENHDRSVALWMFENWRLVLDWLEDQCGKEPNDPFKMLSDLGASHPAHIKRKIREWERAKAKPS